jgi:hypothetical protein
MFIIFGIVLSAVHVQKLEAIHQWGVLLLHGSILLASWQGPIEGSCTFIVVPLDLGSFVGPAAS